MDSPSVWVKFEFKAWATSETVRAMDNRERGIFIMLLCHQCIEGSIPSDLNVIARIVNETPAALRAIWPRHLSGAFRPLKGKRGRIVNPRMDHVIRESKSRTENAQRSANSRWAMRPHSERNATAMLTDKNRVEGTSATSPRTPLQDDPVTFCDDLPHGRSRDELRNRIRCEEPPKFPEHLAMDWSKNPDDLEIPRALAEASVAEFSNISDPKKAKVHVREFLHAIVGVRERGLRPIHAWGAFHNLRRALDQPIFGARAKEALRYLPSRRSVR